MKYTVVGYFEDTEHPFVSWVEAENPEEARGRAILDREEYDENQVADSYTASYMVVIEVFEGHIYGARNVVLGSEL
tara:strand:- start:385 stop:612 length:228 start_codon:yes stop_codon:yes gene_type:complete